MKGERVIEFENGLLVRFPHGERSHVDIFKMQQKLGSKVALFRDVWDSVEAYQEYKQKEREYIEAHVN